MIRRTPAAFSMFIVWLGFRVSEQQCEEQPRQHPEDDRSARAEVRELVLNVSGDHVRGHEPAKCPGWWVRDRPPERPGNPGSASTSACNAPTPSPVTAPIISRSPRLIP